MFSVPLPILWLMPLLQVTNLLFFWLDSVHHWWYDYTLLFPCLFAGLLGGAVYVQGYSRINADFPLELREFAISSAGVADSLGILVADISSLFIQVICFPFHALFLLLRHNLTFHCIHAVKSELYIQSKWHRRCSCWLPYVNIEHTLTVQLVTCIASKMEHYCRSTSHILQLLSANIAFANQIHDMLQHSFDFLQFSTQVIYFLHQLCRLTVRRVSTTEKGRVCER